MKNKECSNETHDRIYRFAEGKITDIEEREWIKKHLIECSSCRQLYADYRLFLSLENEHSKNNDYPATIENEIKNDNDIIFPLNNHYSATIEIGIKNDNDILVPMAAMGPETTNQVAVMSEKTSESVKYELKQDNITNILTIAKSDDEFKFMIQSNKPGSTYRLSGLSMKWRSSVDNGKALFSVLAPDGGDFMLSENDKDIVKIILRKKS